MISLFRRRDRRGIDLVKAGRWDEALAHYQASLQADPRDKTALLESAKIHFRQGRKADAKDFLLRALGLDLDEEEVLQVLDLSNYKRLASDRYWNADPAFSPDGRWVAFASARNDTDGDGKIGPSDRPGLYMAHAEDGIETQVTADDSYNSHPAFSPDGEKIAYLSARGDTNGDGRIDHTDFPGLYLKDMANGREECLVEAAHRPKFPSFSPDGRWLLFSGWYGGAAVSGIYVLDLRTKKVRTLHGAFESNYPVFSPRGDRVLFAGWKRDSDGSGAIDIRDNSCLVECDFKTGKLRVLVDDRSSNSYPCFSPDGESIAYLSRSRDTNGDGEINSLDNSGIYTLRLDRGRPRRIADDRHYHKYPAFSHDGRRILFVGSWRRRGDADPAYFEAKGLHCMRADGENAVEIVSTKHYGCKYAAPSPRANLAAYVSWTRESNRGLYVAPFDRVPGKDDARRFVSENL